MNIIKSIIPALFLLVINGAASVLIKKGFGKTLPLTMMLSSFLICFSQLLFKTFNIGFYLLIAVFICSVCYLIKNRTNLDYMFTNGLYIYLVLLVIFMFINFGRYFYWDDEIGFWGKMVKEMFRMDRFYYLDESLLRGHNDYPPFISCFEYLWCRFALGYSECNITCALHMFEFGLIVPFAFDNSTKEEKLYKTIWKDVLYSLIIVGMVLYLDAGDVFNTIYVDSLIGIEFAYACFLVYTKETDNLFGEICFTLSMVTIIWTKQVGLAFIMLAIAYYVCSSIVNKKKKWYIGSLACVLAPLSAYLLWNKIIEPYYIIKQFDFSKISLDGLKVALSGTTYQFEVIKLYINALFKTAIYENPIKITFISSFAIEVLILEIFKYFSKDKKENTLVEIVCLLGTGGYAVLMLILYTFCYPEREAIVLICYSRYMSSMITGLVLLITLIGFYLFDKILEKHSLEKLLIIVLIILSALCSNRMLSFVPQFVLGNRYIQYEIVSKKIDSKAKENSLIYVLYNHDKGPSYPSCTSYYSDKVFYTKTNEDFFKNNYLGADEYNKAINEFRIYDYVYVVEASESFISYFGELSQSGQFKKDTIYQVIKTNDGVQFIEQ